MDTHLILRSKNEDRWSLELNGEASRIEAGLASAISQSDELNQIVFGALIALTDERLLEGNDGEAAIDYVRAKTALCSLFLTKGKKKEKREKNSYSFEELKSATEELLSELENIIKENESI